MNIPKPSSYQIITSRQKSVKELFDMIKNVLDEEPCYKLKSVQLTIRICKKLLANNLVQMSEDDIMRYAYEKGFT